MSEQDREGSATSHPSTLAFPREGQIWRGLLLFVLTQEGVGTPWSPWILYLVVQRDEVLEAAKAGVGHAGQDGEQHDQEGEQGSRGLQT